MVEVLPQVEELVVEAQVQHQMLEAQLLTLVVVEVELVLEVVLVVQEL